MEFASLATRRGLGEISKQGAEGIKVHSVLVVTTEGIPLGLIKQIAWIRKKTKKGKGYEERKRKIEEKESYRWLESFRETQELVPPEIKVVTVCDREGDIFELLAEEINPPPKEQKVSWLLLTTLPLNNVSDAFTYLKWYSLRWLIERYHFVLKSGCKIEELQLETGERLLRALACYSIVAWRLLWLTYTSRLNPHQPATVALEEEEWQSLYVKIHNKLELPQEIPTIYQCVRWIAKLGGFLGRKGDGEPGVMTLWRGWQRLMDYAVMWKLALPYLW